MTPATAREPGRAALAPLTSLRFAAALLVFAWHCTATRRVAATFSFGYIGVAFFFLLSGFILTYTYQDAFRERLRPAAVRAFYAARFARVYPLHLATMPLMIACLVYLGPNPLWSDVDPHTRLQAVVAQALLVQSWIPVGAIYFGANGPAWSISVEAFFYALFPLVAFVALRLFRSARPSIVVLCALALWAAYAAVLAPQHASIDEWRWYVFPPARLVDFVVGILLGVAFARGVQQQRWPLRATSMEIIAVTAVGLAVYVSPLVPLSLRFSAWVMPAWGFAILIFAQRRGALSRGLAHPVLVRLGEISFAFYLCHLAVIEVVRAGLGLEHPFFVPVALGITLALSFVLFHGVEQPLRARIRAALAARRSLASGAAVGPLAVGTEA